jgi:hypothetical protein
MIAVVRLPIQSKLGTVEHSAISTKPEGYDVQIQKLDELLNSGYRVHAVFPIEDRLYKGAVLILHKDSPDNNLT